MWKSTLFLICFGLLSSCNSERSETSRNDIKDPQQTVLKGTDSTATKTELPENEQEDHEENLVIVPGKSIGLIKLNEQAEVVYKLLGKPNVTDAAMGKVLATWLTVSRLSDPDTANYQTNIFFVRNMGGTEESALAKQIRTSSKEYKLENGIGIGSELKTIQARFPEMKKAATFTSAKTSEPVTIYHEQKSGIAFEINGGGKCVGIGIQEPGKANFEVYSAVSTDLKRL